MSTQNVIDTSIESNKLFSNFYPFIFWHLSLFLCIYLCNIKPKTIIPNVILEKLWNLQPRSIISSSTKIAWIEGNSIWGNSSKSRLKFTLPLTNLTRPVGQYDRYHCKIIFPRGLCLLYALEVWKESQQYETTAIFSNQKVSAALI
jgi:hypothetical protein